MLRNQTIFIVALMLLLGQPLHVYADLTSDLQSEINQKQTRIQELEKQIAQYKIMVQNTKNQGSTLKNEIARMEAQIKKLEAQIKLTQVQISTTALKIDGLVNDIGTQNLKLTEQKNNLQQIFQTINEYDQIGPLVLILNSDSFSDILNQTQYINNLQNDVQEKLIAIRELKAQMEEQKNQNEGYKVSLENLKTQLNGQSRVLDSQKDERQDLLVTTKNQEKQYQNMVNALQKQRDQIENEIFQAEQRLTALINQKLITGGRGSLVAPINASISQSYGCIVSSFAKRSYPPCNEGKGNGGYHNGIDFDGDTGDPVYAAAEGTISGVGNLGKYAYGKWVTITHNNGLTTLYGHMSAQSVSVGQKIQSGQIIGYIGSTGYSTGSHLHFTVYATNTFSIQQKWYGSLPLGGSLNPMLYLP